jgi:predicted nucleotidyltransferase
MSLKVSLDYARIREYCQKWNIREMSLFGSVLRDDFRPDSDVDVLVTFAPDARYGLFQLSRMQRELKAILGRDVDLVERSEVETSDNPIRRRSVLQTAQRIYAA